MARPPLSSALLPTRLCVKAWPHLSLHRSVRGTAFIFRRRRGGVVSRRTSVRVRVRLQTSGSTQEAFFPSHSRGMREKYK